MSPLLWLWEAEHPNASRTATDTLNLSEREAPMTPWQRMQGVATDISFENTTPNQANVLVLVQPGAQPVHASSGRVWRAAWRMICGTWNVIKNY